MLGWRYVPVEDAHLGPSAIATRPVIQQIFIAASAAVTAALERDPMAFERKLYVIRKRVEHAVDALPAGGSTAVLHPEPLVAHVDLQGHADGGADPADVSGSVGPGHGIGAGAGAPAVQDEHVSLVAARASLPPRRAQRRDQHAARQHQLDARARGAAGVAAVRRRPAQAAADHPRGGQRHRDLRQRARAARHGRPIAAARAADDDPRAVVRARAHGSGAQGVLRVPLGADGAVGRSGRDRVHRRDADRRACSIATACVRFATASRATAWSCWRRRPACWICAPEDIVLKDRLQPGRMFLVDTAQGRIVADEEIKRELASAHPYADWLRDNLVRHRRSAAGALSAARRARRRSSSASGCSATPTRTCACCWRRWRRPARRRSARWGPTPRSRCCRTARSCSTTTSSRRSRRSRIRRSTRFASGWSRRWRRRSGRKATCSTRGRSRAGRSRSTTRSSTTSSWRGCATCTCRRSARPRFRRCSIRRERGQGLERALEEVKQRASDAVDAGYTILILSDRDADRHRAPIPSLLATAAVHQHLVRQGNAHAVRAGRRVRGRARSASLRAAPRLRRRRRQSVPRVRDDRRSDPATGTCPTSPSRRRSSTTSTR